MAAAAANHKKRKPDQESDFLLEARQPISYIPKHDADDSDSDDDDISKLLEPLSKEQLVSLLRTAALSHPPTLADIRRAADIDPAHRKIFVHGLDWATTADSLRAAFSPFGPIDDVRIVTDKASGRSKGYGFILFRSRGAARKALKQPQKLIDNRMTSCQLASVGPPATGSINPNPAAGGGSHAANHPVDNLQRKIFVGNVHPDVDPMRLRAYFAQFGEIEEGPVGLDRVTGKPKGFALFVYRTLEGARKALEEPSKNFEGHLLVCQRASDNSNKVAGKGSMGGSNAGGHNSNLNPGMNAMNPTVAQAMAAAVPGNIAAAYPGMQAVPGALPDMTALLAQPNALLTMLGAAGQTPGGFVNPAVFASLNTLAAALGGAATQNVGSVPGVQAAAAVPVSNQGYGGIGVAGYQQNAAGFQASPGFQGTAGFQGPPGFQNAGQVGTQQGSTSVAYQSGAIGQAQMLPRSSVGQMGSYGTQ